MIKCKFFLYFIANLIFSLSLEPCNLTKDEDWVWLRLNRPELLKEGAARGSEKLAKTGRKLEITQVESSDVSDILGMIQELAIYEDMLDQCKMTKEWLDEDFSAGPKFGKFDGNLCVATIAKLDGQVVGYTVSIGQFLTSSLRFNLFQTFTRLRMGKKHISKIYTSKKRSADRELVRFF